jgi:hypothetical protein
MTISLVRRHLKAVEKERFPLSSFALCFALRATQDFEGQVAGVMIIES